VNALREICHYQKHAGTIFPQAAFMRLVRELLNKLRANVTHISASAHTCLQHAPEAYIVTFFKLMYHILITQQNDFSNRAAIHAGCQTIFVKDIRDIVQIVNPSSTLAPTSLQEQIKQHSPQGWSINANNWGTGSSQVSPCAGKKRRSCEKAHYCKKTNYEAFQYWSPTGSISEESTQSDVTEFYHFHRRKYIKFCYFRD
jgi:histone H3/H4